MNIEESIIEYKLYGDDDFVDDNELLEYYFNSKKGSKLYNRIQKQYIANYNKMYKK